VQDFTSFTQYLADQASQHLPQALQRALKRFAMREHASTIGVNLPPGVRVPTYLDTNKCVVACVWV
jgi:hypothetical protein